MSNSEQINILQVLPALGTGGVERYVIDLSIACKKHNVKCIVVSNGGIMSFKLTQEKIKHIKTSIHLKNPISIIKNAMYLKKLIKKYKIDIVHAHSRAPAWAAYFATSSLKIPYITGFHGAYGLNGGALKKMYNSVMNSGELTLAVSQFIRKHISLNYDCSEDKIKVIYPGVDLNMFDPNKIEGERIINITKKWNLPYDIPIIAVPARISKNKGHIDVIEALNKIKHLDFYCIFVGNNSSHHKYIKSLQSLIKKYQLEAKIALVGNSNDMPAVYKLANFVIVPSKKPEAFGLVACEAQAMLKPVIAYNHGGAKENINSEYNYLIKPHSIQELSSTIEKILTTKQQPNNYIDIRQWLIDKGFSKEIMTKKTIKLFKEVHQNNLNKM